MSGGSYNYLCYADLPDLLNKHGEDLRNMVQALSDVGAIDAAGETESIALMLRHFEVRINARLSRLQPVWKAVEWCHSGDSGPEAIDEALAGYRKEIEPSVPEQEQELPK